MPFLPWSGVHDLDAAVSPGSRLLPQKTVKEALVPGNRVDQFRDQLKEGFVYTIVRFDLYDPKKSYRSVDNPLRIYFTMRIVRTEVVLPPENFPMFAYNALPFSMLSDRID